MNGAWPFYHDCIIISEKRCHLSVDKILEDAIPRGIQIRHVRGDLQLPLSFKKVLLTLATIKMVEPRFRL